MMSCWRDVVIVFVCFGVYWNALLCGFVFDDASAIKDNADLRPSTNWSDLFFNDFWGTPMKEERSHKSYRPVTVLTFRCNYLLHQLNPMGYHLVNVVLHALVCIAFHRFGRQYLEPDAAFFSSLYFAVHPVHTEAVTGVVGRAELLSALMTSGILILYERVRLAKWISHWIGVLTIGSMLAVGTLCKEQCITTVGVLFAYELILVYQSFLNRLRKKASDGTRSIPTGNSWTMDLRFFCDIHALAKSECQNARSFLANRIFQRLVVLFACCGGIMLCRIRIMSSQLPHFTEFDNPAAHAPPLIRRLTHLYLIPVNLWLLLCPCDLCADWTLGSLRLIEGWTDPRNIFTVITFSLLFICGLLVFYPRTRNRYSRAMVMALSLLVFPFLPASNLFFYVGFVVAERVLYTPSLGFSLLIGLGYQLACRMSDKSRAERRGRLCKFRIYLLAATILLVFSLKTIRRNFDWTDEYSLFSSALKVNPRNAKMWNNVGHALEAMGDYHQALGYFHKAVEVQPNDIGARINVGRTYVNLHSPEEAEEAYFKALDYFPKPIKGKTYYARVAPKDLMVFVNLANLYLNKTPPLLDDAARLLRRAISLRSDFVDAYQNYGSVLIKQGKIDEAESVYRTALTYQERNADLHYNLGVVLLESGRRSEGLQYLNNALNYKPEHLPTMFALASTLTETNDTNERERGKQLLEILAERGYEPVRVHFALGMLETDLKNYIKAAAHYHKTIELDPEHRSALFNLALLSRNQLNDHASAVPLLERILKVYPDHMKSYLLLGDIELTERKKPEVALRLFRQALELQPGNIQAKHNICVALAEQDDLEASEECFLEAIQMAPKEAYLYEHLRVVRKRLDLG